MKSSKTPITIEYIKSIISPEWLYALNGEFDKPYWKILLANLNDAGIFYPAKPLMFAALNDCPPSKVRVVIVGQDPYIGYLQAHGYSFSVQKICRIPASLNRIFQELKDEYQIEANPPDGYLGKWEDEGVLLFNTVLTVTPGKSRSHYKFGWQNFSKSVLEYLDRKGGVIFVGWGNDAIKILTETIKSHQSTILTAGHPSPLNTSITRPFLGCNHFRQINEILMNRGELPIRWCSIFKDID